MYPTKIGSKSVLMASLAFVTREMRTILKYAGIGLVILILLIFVIRGLLFIKETLLPSKPPPPKQEFGKLSRYFNNATEATKLNFRINTIDGTLPVLPDRMNVYKLKQFRPDLLALDRAKSKLSISFPDNIPIKISDTIYQWNEPEKNIQIQYNIVNNNFSITSNFLDNPSLLSSGILPTRESVLDQVENYLSSFEADKSDIDFDSSGVDYMELKDRKLEKAANLGTAKFVIVNLLQKKVDETPIIYSETNQSNMSFVISYPNQSFTIVEGQFYHYLPLLEEKSDYPIKSAEQALEDLKSGKAKIFNPNGNQNIDITDIHLKYYLDKNTNAYLQPIIVFSGINFTAYVDALPDTSLQ